MWTRDATEGVVEARVPAASCPVVRRGLDADNTVWPAQAFFVDLPRGRLVEVPGVEALCWRSGFIEPVEQDRQRGRRNNQAQPNKSTAHARRIRVTEPWWIEAKKHDPMMAKATDAQPSGPPPGTAATLRMPRSTPSYPAGDAPVLVSLAMTPPRQTR